MSSLTNPFLTRRGRFVLVVAQKDKARQYEISLGTYKNELHKLDEEEMSQAFSHTLPTFHS